MVSIENHRPEVPRDAVDSHVPWHLAICCVAAFPAVRLSDFVGPIQCYYPVRNDLQKAIIVVIFRDFPRLPI